MFIWTPCSRLPLNIFPDFEVLTPLFIYLFLFQQSQQTGARIRILLWAALHKCVARASRCLEGFYNQHSEERQLSRVETGIWRQRNLSKVKDLFGPWLLTGSAFPTLTPSPAFCNWVGFSSGLPSCFAPPFGEPSPLWSDLRGDGCEERSDIKGDGSAAGLLNFEPCHQQLSEPHASGGQRRNPQQTVMKCLTPGRVSFWTAVN